MSLSAICANCSESKVSARDSAAAARERLPQFVRPGLELFATEVEDYLVEVVLREVLARIAHRHSRGEEQEEKGGTMDDHYTQYRGATDLRTIAIPWSTWGPNCGQ